MLPGVVTLAVFGLLGLAEGDASRGYTLFGSKRLGGLLFLYMVSLMVTGPIILIAFLIGVWKLF